MCSITQTGFYLKKKSLKKTQKIIWMFHGNRLAKLYGRYVLRRSYVTVNCLIPKRK